MSKNGKILLATGLGAAILAAGVVVGAKYARELLEAKKIKFPGKSSSDNSVHYAESKSSENRFIGDEKAGLIAIKEAGISVNEIENFSAKLNYVDGVWQYEVQFSEDGTDHTYIIKADDGTVLDWNAEFED